MRERGAAVVDFVLVLVVLVPLVLGILQVALVMQVRNTLAAVASEGARVAATADRGPAEAMTASHASVGQVPSKPKSSNVPSAAFHPKYSR